MGPYSEMVYNNTGYIRIPDLGSIQRAHGFHIRRALSCDRSASRGRRSPEEDRAGSPSYGYWALDAEVRRFVALRGFGSAGANSCQ